MIFPLAAAALSVVFNGIPVRSYRRAFISHGRVMAPPEPFLTAMTASIERTGDTILVRRGDRFAQARLVQGAVAIAPIMRALGAAVVYDSAAHVLNVSIAAPPFATATPFNRAVPQAAARAVFTPTPVPTNKPVVTGKPVPRRTPQTVNATSATPAPPAALRHAMRRARKANAGRRL